jgi:hypothetical protein
MARLVRVFGFIAAESLLAKMWLLLTGVSLILVICSWLRAEYNCWWLTHVASLPVVMFGFSIFVATSGSALGELFLRSRETKSRLPLLYWVSLVSSLAYLLLVVFEYAQYNTNAHSPRPLHVTSRVFPSVDLALSLCLFGISHWASTSEQPRDAV